MNKAGAPARFPEASSLQRYFKLCKAVGREQDIELIEPIIVKFREIEQRGGDDG